jgi:hypothetical protein
MGFFKSLLQDENGQISSKRFAGLICVLFLNATLLISSFSHRDIEPAESLVNVVAFLAFGSLGLSSIDKYTKMKSDVKQALKDDEEK